MATVAHEFRTPLTSLRMAVHLCLEGIAGPVTEKQIELLHAAREDCERLQGMIEDLLDLARIASVGSRCASCWCRCRTSSMAWWPRVRRRRKKRRAARCRALTAVAAEDPRRSRAAGSGVQQPGEQRHPPHSRWRTRVTVRALSAGQSARFEVSDTGEGIPLAYQREIFLRFFRVPGSPPGGAGSGLCRSPKRSSRHTAANQRAQPARAGQYVQRAGATARRPQGRAGRA